MDYKIILHLFPILMLLLVLFVYLEMRSSGYKIKGTKDWIFSYFFFCLYAIVEIFFTDKYYLYGAMISSLFYITAFIYIQYSLSKYNDTKHYFFVSLFSGFLFLIFGLLNWWLKFDTGLILNIVYSTVMIVILTETILFTRKTRYTHSKINYFKPFCFSLAFLIVYFIARLMTNYDFGIIHDDESSFLHTYLYISHLAILISVALSMNYIYKWYYINELSVASELQNSILEEITILSITDELTKIFNRRHIESLISDAMNQYNETRSNNGFCVAIIDIDRFKYINDNFGHKKGDEVLIKFSEIFRENLRQNDKIGRWGGDEFLILFSDMSITEAKNFMENQQKLLLSTDFDIDFSLSFSYGIKVYDSSLDYTQFFRIIDHLLYTNKNSKQSD